MSSCIVLIEDLKTGAPGVSAFGGVWTGGVTGDGDAEGGFSFMSGLGWGSCIGGLEGGMDTAGPAPSFVGRLGGMGPPRLGPPVGGILICGLIGLAEPLGVGLAVKGLIASEGFVGSAMFTQRDTNTRITHELHESFVTFVPIGVFVSGLLHCQINSTIVVNVFHTNVDNLAELQNVGRTTDMLF